MQFSNLIILFGALILVLSHEQTQKKLQQSVKQAVVYKYLIFTQNCYNTFFNEQNLFHFQCLKKTVIKLLGYCLVLGGAIIKFPQIIKILKLKSIKGVSFTSVIFELTTNILASGYSIYKGNPFSLYGQNVFIGIQMLIIISLFLFFGNGNKIVYFTFFFLMIGVSYYVSDPHHLPSFIIQHSMTVQTILISTSRLLQIFQVYRLKSTGSLALLTWALNFCGNIARIMTILFEAANDYRLLFSLVAVATLNLFIVFQFYLYRKSTPTEQSKIEKTQ